MNIEAKEKVHEASGLLVRTTGEVFIPPRNAGRRGVAPGYWTFGSKSGRYASVKFHGKVYHVHRLVAETFIQNPENKPTVDHINRNRFDNRVENLRWATQKEQIDNSSHVIDRIDYGVRKCEDRNAWERARRAYQKELLCTAA